VICIELEKNKEADQPQKPSGRSCSIWPRSTRSRGRLKSFSSRFIPVDIRHNAKIFREQLADWADPEGQAGSQADGRAPRPRTGIADDGPPGTRPNRFWLRAAGGFLGRASCVR